MWRQARGKGTRLAQRKSGERKVEEGAREGVGGWRQGQLRERGSGRGREGKGEEEAWMGSEEEEGGKREGNKCWNILICVTWRVKVKHIL